MDVEAVVPLPGCIPESERVQVYELPGVEQMACSVHYGPFAALPQAYQGLLAWIEPNGYHINCPARELYHAYVRGGDQNKNVTEVQFPVKK